MIFLGAIAILLVILMVLVLTMKPQQAPEGSKIASVPIEIKSQSEAATLEKDTSSILKEVQGALAGIDSSLPEV